MYHSTTYTVKFIQYKTVPYFLFLIPLLTSVFPSYQPATCLGSSSENCEANPWPIRRIHEGCTAKTEGMKPFTEALPKNATLFGRFYVGAKLFFDYYSFIYSLLAGVAPPPPPPMHAFMK